MPFIRISIAGDTPSRDQVTALQVKTTQLMADILGKRSEVTVVAVELSEAAAWSVGGECLAEGRQLAQMEAFITAGTNSKQEKADFIAAAYQMLSAVFGGAMSPLYVVIIEVDAADWGYDGNTQAYRKRVAPTALRQKKAAQRAALVV